MNELINGLYTTPEQSKQLLELGVPADSADCIYVKHVMNSDYDLEILKERSYSEEVSEFEGFYDYIPCWSVGRLIEIYVNLSSHEYVSLIFKKTFTPMDKILDKFEKDVENGLLDLSKLK